MSELDARIYKLLNLANNNENSYEAAVALQKAQELIGRKINLTTKIPLLEGHVEMPSWKQRCKDFFNAKKKTIVLSWESFFERTREPICCLQIKPDATIRNYNVENIAKAFANFYETPMALWKEKRYEDTFSFEILLSKSEISFFVTCPERLKRSIKNVLESVWEKATIVEVEPMKPFESNRTSGAELQYRQHDVFAIDTDARANTPMPSLYSVTKDMEEGERAFVQVLCTPMNPLQWQYDSQQAYEKFLKGKMPTKAFST